VPWPYLGSAAPVGPGKHEIEPGEVEQTEYDFVLDRLFRPSRSIRTSGTLTKRGRNIWVGADDPL